MDQSEYHSKEVTSNQPSLHEKLESTVNKHLQTEYRKPFQEHNLLAFEKMQLAIEKSQNKNLILDSCCGTGASTISVAIQNPDKLVFGIDQSYHRLNKKDDLRYVPDNCIFLQANCEDVWRLCVENQICFEKHFILYPNPWPKSEHLKRRWHGHPVFKVLPELSNLVELRSNWQLYLEEFAFAWELATEKMFFVNEFKVEEPLTLFEKKYHFSGQVLYRLEVESRSE